MFVKLTGIHDAKEIYIQDGDCIEAAHQEWTKAGVAITKIALVNGTGWNVKESLADLAVLFPDSSFIEVHGVESGSLYLLNIENILSFGDEDEKGCTLKLRSEMARIDVKETTAEIKTLLGIA